MKISVIIPCYNAARYLAACLESVLAQSEQDFEIILVDDGSADETLHIMEGFAQRDARITVLHQQNAGVSAARNLGLLHARGEWITFVDGDDLLVPDAFAVMLSAADDRTDMVVCAHETFDEAGNREVFWPDTRWMDKQGEEKRRAAACRLIEGDSVLNIMCNKLHRCALLQREGIALKAGVAIAEDALFNLEAVLCGGEIRYVNRITYRYRIHSASATQTRAAGEFDVHLPWLLAMRAMLERCGVMEQYYCAYVDSVVLRLYKDGKIPGVLREFDGKAKPLLMRGDMDIRRMRVVDRVMVCLCENGGYKAVYPLIALVQMAGRKVAAAAFRLRAAKERPV